MEEKFKELNMAHEVLSDPDSRKKYDQYGHRWRDAEAYERARREAGAAGGGAGFGGTGGGFRWQTGGGPGAQFEDAEDMGDVFARFFRDREQAGGASFRGFAMPGADLETSVRLSIRDVLRGVSRRIELSEPVACKACGGTGRQGEHLCGTCGGTGTQTDRRTIDVKIPPGVHDGMRMRVAGQGAPGSNGGRRGDLYLRIEVVADKVFRRHGDDIHVSLPVWPWEAALGAEVLAPTLTDPVRVKVPPGSRTGSKLRLKGKGLPREGGAQGDLFFIVQIVVPSSITDQERALYEQLGRLRAEDPRSELLRDARHG
jgi:DnaJ-class molecular chaperone